MTTRRALLLTLGIVVTSCLSPTLPLPPPNRPNVDGPDSTGNVTLSGNVVPGATVYANNLDTGNSAGQKTDPQSGAYRFKIGASIGDQLEFFYIYDSVTSEHTFFTISGPSSTASSNSLADASVSYSEVDASVAPPR